MKMHVDSIQKNIGGKPLLQDVFLSCETGRITGLFGRNGSGKSTLLKIIFGVVPAEMSFVRVGNAVMKSQADRKGKITYLPQNHFLPQNIKVKNFLPLFCNAADCSFLAAYPLLVPFLDSKCAELSGGEKRLVEILLIVFSDSDFSLLDEPFHSLSPKVAQEISELISRKKTEKGFLITDHNYRKILEISDSLFLLSRTAVKPVSSENDLKFFGYLR